MKLHSNSTSCALLGSTVILCASFPAFGEGKNVEGGQGVNRRVQSPGGHVEAEGDFVVTNFKLPNPRLVRSKPTFYLGHTGSGVNGEGGFQYEYDPQSNVGSTPNPAGWVIFMRVTDYNNHGNDNIINAVQPTSDGFFRAYRICSQLPPQIHLEYQVHNGGGLSLKVGGLPGVSGSRTVWYTPINAYSLAPASRPTGLYPTNQSDASLVMPLDKGSIKTTDLQVRRVIGVTQDGGGTKEGTEFSCRFESGAVGKFNPLFPASPTIQAWQWSGLSSNNRVDQSETGYDVDAKLKGIVPPNQPDCVVDFPLLNVPNNYPAGPYGARYARNLARTDTFGSYLLVEEDVTRYRHETVKITLHDYPNGRGRKKNRKRGGGSR